MTLTRTKYDRRRLLEQRERFGLSHFAVIKVTTQQFIPVIAALL